MGETIVNHLSAGAFDVPTALHRRIVARTRGAGHGGPIVRLMSPSDLGQTLKPFVFLDLVDANSSIAARPNRHPHSGIATVTVITEGNLRFDKPGWGNGVLDHGGVEWMRAGSAIWHGDEFKPDSARRFKAFQLWVALPAEIEASSPEWQFVEAKDIPAVGPAKLIVGQYEGQRSPVRSFDGLNYLLITLNPGEEWVYTPPAGHAVGWLSLSHGSIMTGEAVAAGEMIVFEEGCDPIIVRAGDEGAIFVLGSAVPHQHELVLGYYSVHTSAAALAAGEARIAEVRFDHI